MPLFEGGPIPVRFFFGQWQGDYMGTPRLLDVTEAARYLGLSKWTIRGFIERGLLRAIGLPPVNGLDSHRLRRILLDRRDLDAFIDAHKETPRLRSLEK